MKEIMPARAWAGPAERIVDGDAEPQDAAERQVFPLDLAEENVVAGLDAIEASKPFPLAESESQVDLLGYEVRSAERTNLVHRSSRASQ